MAGFGVKPVKQAKASKIRGPSLRHNAPGGRHGTSLAQRNASRRNVRRAQIAKQARRLK